MGSMATGGLAARPTINRAYRFAPPAFPALRQRNPLSNVY